jgi:hypothetical protein
VDRKSAHGREREKAFLRMKEQCGDVYENKGAPLNGAMESGNVIENTDSYAL